MGNIFKERVEKIRTLMAQNDLQLYYIPMDDCHNSEYVGDHFKAIAYVSGFTGSAASIVITETDAYLWTDGRYFLQAGQQLVGSDIHLMKMGEEGVPKLADFLNEKLAEGKTLGFEGRVISTEFAEKLNGTIVYNVDLVSEIWTDRPAQQFSEIKCFAQYSGEATESKLEKVRALLAKATDKNYLHIINALDDIAWLFNVRANDVAYNPVTYAYAVITPEDAYIYNGEGAVTEEVKAYYASVPVKTGSYEDMKANCLDVIEKEFSINAEDRPVILLDKERISYDMYQSFVDAGYEVVGVDNPTSELKAVKNETEIKNTMDAQIKDGVAVVKFMKWLKENAGKQTISECDACDKLLAFRAEQKDFIEPSFGTIAGYASNAAIIHYAPQRGTDAQIEAKGMLLLDSGGHYLNGTTDTTRTIVLGEISAEEKKCFTLVAASMLRLMNFNERKAEGNFTGVACDELARAVLKEHGYNYNHGTGHGIGYVLNVHEQPPVISTTRDPKIANKPFVPGMISSDEPGIYVDGAFGIRTENDILVVEREDEKGTYLAFENMTFVPIDIDGIDTDYLSPEDLENLNNYNSEVYQALAPQLDAETAEWLKRYTQPVK